MARSSTKELITPFEKPESAFYSKRRLYETPSLVESSSPEKDLFSDIKEHSKEETIEIMTEIMGKYMSKTRGNYGSGVVRPKTNDKTHFELKGPYLKELRENTFSGSKHEDANEHIKKVLEIINLFHIPEVFDLNDKLSSSDASFAKSKAKGKEMKKKIYDGFKRGLSMHWTKDEFVDVLKKMANFMPANVPASREVHVFPPTKESIMTLTSKSLEFSTNVYFTASVVASEHNEDMVNAEVDRSDLKMIDDTATVKSGHAFVHGIFVSLDDVVELVKVGSRRVSTAPMMLWLPFLLTRKVYFLLGEGHVWILCHATHPRLNGFHLRTCSIAGQASVGSMG
nr:hypothetical protein [Tanacetum cinerariifolium]